jgi:hypothetical protein
MLAETHGKEVLCHASMDTHGKDIPHGNAACRGASILCRALTWCMSCAFLVLCRATYHCRVL